MRYRCIWCGKDMSRSEVNITFENMDDGPSGVGTYTPIHKKPCKGRYRRWLASHRDELSPGTDDE